MSSLARRPDPPPGVLDLGNGEVMCGGTAATMLAAAAWLARAYPDGPRGDRTGPRAGPILNMAADPARDMDAEAFEALAQAGETAAPAPRKPASRRGSQQHKATGRITPSDFFDKYEGLLAATLTSEIERLGPIATDKTGILYHYTDGAWCPNGERIVRKRAAQLLGEWYRKGHASIVVDILSNREPAIDDAKLDTRYLNLPNGLLDWRTAELKEHDPAVRSITRIPVEWDPDAKCPEIEAWLDEVMPKDSREFIEEVIGYALYSGNPLHKAVMAYGRGRNGKGTFLRLITALAGAENCCSVSPQSLDDNRFMAAELYGKIANLVGDVDPRTFQMTENFKKSTGDDTMTVEHKNGHPFQIKARALTIAGFNAMPRTADTSTGFFSRWLVIPFTRYYPEELADRTLDTRLHAPAELRGLLVLAVAGLRRLMERGHFTPPASVNRAMAAFRAAADPVTAWMTEKTEGNYEGWLPRADLYEGFGNWCAANGHQPMGAAKLYERMQSASEDLYGYPLADRKRSGARGFAGIAWRKADTGDDEPEDGTDQDGQLQFTAPEASDGGRRGSQGSKSHPPIPIAVSQYRNPALTALPAPCEACSLPLDDLSITSGHTTHPSCDGTQ